MAVMFSFWPGRVALGTFPDGVTVVSACNMCSNVSCMPLAIAVWKSSDLTPAKKSPSLLVRAVMTACCQGGLAHEVMMQLNGKEISRVLS